MEVTKILFTVTVKADKAVAVLDAVVAQLKAAKDAGNILYGEYEALHNVVEPEKGVI